MRVITCVRACFTAAAGLHDGVQEAIAVAGCIAARGQAHWGVTDL